MNVLLCPVSTMLFCCSAPMVAQIHVINEVYKVLEMLWCQHPLIEDHLCRVELGRALAKMGQKEAALQELEQAVTMEEEDINAHLQKVCCFIESLLLVTCFEVLGSGVLPDRLTQSPQVPHSCT